MAHLNQRNFCKEVKKQFPSYFKNKKVLDCGSLDVNGNNRYLFDNCKYTGIDIGEGKNVDIVSKIHEFKGKFDLIISTECFEHDMYYEKSLQNIVSMLNSGGLFLFTCATHGRNEHGTAQTNLSSAPLLSGEWSNYYKNLAESDIKQAIDINVFKEYQFRVNLLDLYFWGIK